MIFIGVVALAIVFTLFGYAVGIYRGVNMAQAAINHAVKSGHIVIGKGEKWNSQ